MLINLTLFKQRMSLVKIMNLDVPLDNVFRKSLFVMCFGIVLIEVTRLEKHVVSIAFVNFLWIKYN